MELIEAKEKLELSLKKIKEEYKNAKEPNEELKNKFVSAFNENEESKKKLDFILVKINKYLNQKCEFSLIWLRLTTEIVQDIWNKLDSWWKIEQNIIPRFFILC